VRVGSLESGAILGNMVRSALLAVVAVLLAPAVAGAALPAANPPDVAALKAQGVEVEWPLTASVELSRMHYLNLRVRSRKPVTLSLIAVGRKGRPLRSVARKTLRSGTFEQYLVMARARRLALRLDVGKQRYWSWITVRADDRPAVTCEHGTETAPTLQLPAAPLRLGQPFNVGLRNGGRCPLGVLGLDLTWYRPSADGGWESVPIDCGTGALITEPTGRSICDRVGVVDVVGPGAIYDERTTTPSGLPPGRYLLKARWRDDQPPLQREVDLVA